MRFIDFFNTVKLFGFEYFNKYYGCYRGYVAYNDDPKGMCRLRVCVPSIFGKYIPEQWALPKGMIATNEAGLILIPSEADPIWVSFENGDSRYPIWEYGWYIKDKVPENDGDGSLILQYGGHRIKLDKINNLASIITKDGTAIELNNDNLTLTHKNGNVIDISKTINLGTKNKASQAAILGDKTEEYLKKILQEVSEISVTTPDGVFVINNQAKIVALVSEASQIKSTKVTLD